MPGVTSYHILFYGSADGYQTNRAQIALYNGSKTVGFVRFNDPGMPFENDYADAALYACTCPAPCLKM